MVQAVQRESHVSEWQSAQELPHVLSMLLPVGSPVPFLRCWVVWATGSVMSRGSILTEPAHLEGAQLSTTVPEAITAECAIMSSSPIPACLRT